MKRRHLVLAAATAVLLIVPAAAQRRDPLTEKEVTLMRNTADEPLKRMHYMVTFAQARMEMIEHLRSDQRMASTQADKIGETLDDIASIVDEIDDNLDNYNKKGEDLRKALREIVELDSNFQLKLRSIKESSTQEQLKDYGFALDTAIESVNSSADSARVMLDDQNATKGKEKVEKEAKSKPAKPPKEKKDRPDYTGMGGIGRDKDK